MTNAAKATGAALSVGSGLRRQIRALNERDGLGAEDISVMLEIPVEIVSEILGGRVEVAKAAEGDILSERLKRVESVAAGCLDDALNTLQELAVGAESEAVRSVSAQRLVEYATGSLRPKKSEGSTGTITIDNLNVIIQQAMSAHAAQLSAATPKEITV